VAAGATCRRWSRALGAVGLEAVPLPWSQAQPEPAAAPLGRALEQGRGEFLLFTSRNAVAVLPPGCGRGHRCACVGSATAQAAGERGFEVILTGEAGGEELARQLLARVPDLSGLLFPCGRVTRPEAKAVLSAAGISVRSVTVYALEARTAFAGEVAAAPSAAALLLGSPRAVDALQAALARTGRHLAEGGVLVVPGSVAARHAAGKLLARICTAQHVDAAGLARAVLESLAETENKDDG